MKSVTAILMIFTAIFGSSLSPAHTRWSLNGSLPPRSDDSGIKSNEAPCGTKIFDKRTPLKGGTTFTIQWEETIDHPGHFEIWFSHKEDSNWVLIKTIEDNKNNTATPHVFTNTIIVPDTNCDKCTLQIRQIMTDRDPPTIYYSCADIKITSTSPKPPPNSECLSAPNPL